MLLNEIAESHGALGLYLALVFFGMSMYIVLSGSSYLIFFVWKREKFVPDYKPNRKEQVKSVWWAFLSVAGNSVLMVPIELAIFRGNSKLYYSIDEYGWPYILVSILGVLFVTETLIYWIHRALHIPWLYKSLHRYHHQFHVPTPLASLAFHPLDSFAQALPHHLCAFLFPMYAWVYHGFVSFVTVWAVLIHDRIGVVSSKWVNNTGHHTAHHWYNKYNFGQFFTFWDRIGGTYRTPADLPERFFSSWPKATRQLRRQASS